MIVSFWNILKMNESNSIETIDRANLTDQTKFRLNEIRLKIILTKKLKERKLNSKKISKYVTVFNYIDKMFIILSATSDGVSIISFTTVIGASVGIVSASFTLFFSLNFLFI